MYIGGQLGLAVQKVRITSSSCERVRGHRCDGVAERWVGCAQKVASHRVPVGGFEGCFKRQPVQSASPASHGWLGPRADAERTDRLPRGVSGSLLVFLKNAHQPILFLFLSSPSSSSFRSAVSAGLSNECTLLAILLLLVAGALKRSEPT